MIKLTEVAISGTYISILQPFYILDFDILKKYVPSNLYTDTLYITIQLFIVYL